MPVNKNRRNHRSLICSVGAGLVVAVFLSSLVFGQQRTQRAFEAVPVAARGRLIARLRLLIKYQHELRWDKQFDLLSSLYLQGENENKENFVKNSKRYYSEGLVYKLIDFVPRAADGPDKIQDWGEWAIWGCGHWRVKGRTVKYDSSVIAVRERGDWFFSEVNIVTSVGGPPKPCPN